MRWGIVLFAAGLVAASLMAIFLASQRLPRSYEPLSIQQATLLRSDTGADEVLLAGQGFDRNLRAVLIPGFRARGDSSRQLLDVPVKALAVAGSGGLLVGTDDTLLTLDLKGQSPTVAGSVVLPGKVGAIARVGNRVAVGMIRKGGFSLVDIRNPGEPSLGRQIRHPGSIMEMQAFDGRVYCADYFGGLAVLDLSMPRARLTTHPGPRLSFRLAQRQRRLAVGGVSGELWLYDLAASGQPQVAARLQRPGLIRGLAMTDRYLFACHSDGVLEVLDLTDWPRAQSVASIRLPGQQLRIDLLAEQGLLLASTSGVGDLAIDISAPRAPRLLGPVWGTGPHTCLALVGDLTFIGSRSGLQLADLMVRQGPPGGSLRLVSDAEMELLNWQGVMFGYDGERLVPLAGARSDHRADASDRFALYAAFRREGLTLYEWRSRELPEPVGRLELPFSVKAALCRERRLYVLGLGVLEVFDAQDPARLVRLARLPLEGRASTMVWRDPGYLLVATAAEGLLVVDVRDAAQPRLVAGLALPEHLRELAPTNDLAVAADLAFMANRDGGIMVADVSDPLQPRFVQRLSTPGKALHLSVQDGLLMVIPGDRNRLFLADARPSRELTMIAAMEMPLQPRQADQAAGALFVTARNGALISMDAPRLLDRVQVNGAARARVALPAELPPGSYELVLYDERRSAKIAVTLGDAGGTADQ